MTKDELREQVRELARDLWSEAWQEGESAANAFSWGCSVGVSERDENVSEATDAILALIDQAKGVPVKPSDDAVERCCDAFWSQTCEPGQEHDRARKALVSPMRAALAALKPGDKVGDGCVVVPLEPSEEAIKSARKATALHASIRPKLRSIEDREKLERELLKVGISAAYAIDARPVVSEEKWSSEIVPNRRGGGWIARAFLNGELDHERSFESLDAATEHAEHFAALTPTEGGE